MREANVLINGVALTDAQARTLRVAVSSFLMDLTPERVLDLGPIGSAYQERAREVEAMLVGAPRPSRDPCPPTTEELASIERWAICDECSWSGPMSALVRVYHLCDVVTHCPRCRSTAILDDQPRPRHA